MREYALLFRVNFCGLRDVSYTFYGLHDVLHLTWSKRQGDGEDGGGGEEDGGGGEDVVVARMVVVRMVWW